MARAAASSVAVIRTGMIHRFLGGQDGARGRGPTLGRRGGAGCVWGSSGRYQRIDMAADALQGPAIRISAARHMHAVVVTVVAGALWPRKVMSVFRMAFILNR